MMQELLGRLLPDEYRFRIQDIGTAELAARGISGVIVDLDNTLVLWNDSVLEEGIRDWVKRLKDAGIKVCIASNSSNIARVEQIAATLGIPMLCRAAKPFRRAYTRAMSLMGTQPENTAVIGDQVFTDVLGGKRLGLHTILVVPLGSRDFVGTRLVRIVENYCLSRALRLGMLKPAKED